MLSLGQFTGTDNWYKHFTGLLYTDGVQYLAEEAKAYWLIDAIFSHIVTNKAFKHEDFVACKLKLTETGGAILNLEDGNDNVIASQVIPFTNFPFEDIEDDELMLFFENDVLYLPSER